MMFDAFADVNWFAVTVAALAYYLLGAVWFTPLFGRTWDTAIGHARDEGGGFSTAYYVVPLISSVLVASALAVIVAAAKLDRLTDGVALGLVVGLGVAAVSVNNALTPHTPRPFLLGSVTGGYHLVGITIVAVILVSWGR